jgi:hypothetical protein
MAHAERGRWKHVKEERVGRVIDCCDMHAVWHRLHSKDVQSKVDDGWNEWIQARWRPSCRHGSAGIVELIENVDIEQHLHSDDRSLRVALPCMSINSDEGTGAVSVLDDTVPTLVNSM